MPVDARSGLVPGDGGNGFGLRHVGPLVFRPSDNHVREVETVPIDERRSLCGRRMDWVELVEVEPRARRCLLTPSADSSRAAPLVTRQRLRNSARTSTVDAPGLDSLLREWTSLPFPDTPAKAYAQGMHKRPLDYYVRRLAKVELGGGSALDAGCGTGTWSFALRERFDEVIGIDRNEPRIDLARWIAERHEVDVRFDVGDVTQLELPDGKVDAAICYGVVISYLSPSVVLAELRRVLRPGGLLYLCINGLGWSMYLRDERGASDERAAELGRSGIYHTASRRLDRVREALLDEDVRAALGPVVNDLAGPEMVAAVDAWLSLERGLRGLAPAGRFIGAECGSTFQEQFETDVAALIAGEIEHFSHNRAGCGYDAWEIEALATQTGFEGFRWAEEGRLLGSPTNDVAVDPIFGGWFNGHQQVWECLLRRRD
jgi:SAM-dependent methyltransferase